MCVFAMDFAGHSYSMASFLVDVDTGQIIIAKYGPCAFSGDGEHVWERGSHGGVDFDGVNSMGSSQINGMILLSRQANRP